MLTPKPARRLILLLSLLLLAPLLACQAGPTWRGSVKVGLAVPFYGYDSGSANAAYLATKLALRERNESGGIGGRWVELVALDDQNSPEIAAGRARELALDPAVLGVIGHLSADAALGAAGDYQRTGLPAIILGGSGDRLGSDFPGLLRMAPSDSSSAARALETATRNMPLRRIAILHDNSQGNSAAAEAFLKEANRLKLDVAAVTGVEREEREFGLFLGSLLSNPPQLVIFAGDQFQAAALASQVKGGLEGVRLLIYGCANTPDFVTIAGKDAIGVLHVDYTAVAGDAAGERFIARYRSAFGFPPTAYAVLAYDAGNLLMNAMKSASGSGNKLDRVSVGQETVKLVKPAGTSGNRGILADDLWIATASNLYEIDQTGYPGKLWR